MPTIEERALALVTEIAEERWSGKATVSFSRYYAADEAICRLLETLDAERAEFYAYKHEVSRRVRGFRSAWQHRTPSRDGFDAAFERFIIPEPVDPLLHLAREMALLDGVVRTDSQKAAIREGRAANTAADDFYDRLRTALPARGLKLVEVGDAD